MCWSLRLHAVSRGVRRGRRAVVAWVLGIAPMASSAHSQAYYAKHPMYHELEIQVNTDHADRAG